MDYSKCSDETLVELYRAGNELAVEVLFDRYKNLVRKKARAIHLLDDDCEDLIQEGMIGLYKATRGYDENKEAKFGTFASLCIDRQIMSAVTARNAKKHGPLNTYVSFDSPAFSDDGSEVTIKDTLTNEKSQNPEKIFLEKEATSSFEEKMEKTLSKYEREVLRLYFEEKDYQEIARILNKEPKSVDNAFQRIKAKASKLKLVDKNDSL